MKKYKFLLPLVVLGLFFIFNAGCEVEPVESCEQDEICTGKSVTACCTETECYYTFNDKKYGDDAESLAQLATDLGCATASGANYQEDIEILIYKLAVLSEKARLKTLK